MEKMKPLILLCGILIILFVGCNSEVKQSKHQLEHLELKTDADKRVYLEKIFEDDQSVRGAHGSEIMLKFGKASDEYRHYVQTQISQDSINLQKIEKYLAEYGHPKISEVGSLAAQTPWAVIHHASTYDDRERNFEYLYRGYLTGDIDDGAFSMFLGRMYQITNGERFKIESPYKSEDEINQLIKELSLEGKKAKVQQELKPS